MKLSRLPSLPFPLSLITPFTWGVIVRGSRCAQRQIRGVVVLLAVLTLPPSGMSAGGERPFPLLNQEVVGSVGTQQQVLGTIVRADVIPVMDFLSAFQTATEGAFDYKDVLKDVPAVVCVRVFMRPFLNISIPGGCHPATPVPVLLPVQPWSVVTVKHHRLPSSSTTRSGRLLGERSGQPASALTETRRICQSRAPNVCADYALNLTHSGGFRG